MALWYTKMKHFEDLTLLKIYITLFVVFTRGKKVDVPFFCARLAETTNMENSSFCTPSNLTRKERPGLFTDFQDSQAIQPKSFVRL